MRAILRVFARDADEFRRRPYVLAWLVAVPLIIFLTCVGLQVREPQTRLLLSVGPGAPLTADQARALLDALGDLDIREIAPPVSAAVAMSDHGAPIAAIWTTHWQIFVQERSGSRLELAGVIARRVGATLSAQQPLDLQVGRQLGDSSDDRRGPDLSGVDDYHVIPLPIASAKNAEIATSMLALFPVVMAFALAAIALVRELEQGTIGYLVNSPSASWPLVIIGKLCFPVWMALVCFLMLLIVAVPFYEIRVPNGMVPAVVLAFVCTLWSGALGLAASAVLRSQLHAYLASAVYVICSLLFTGFVYPLSQASEAIRAMSWFFPLTLLDNRLTAWLLDDSLPLPSSADLIPLMAAMAATALLLVLSAYRLVRRV